MKIFCLFVHTHPCGFTIRNISIILEIPAILAKECEYIIYIRIGRSNSQITPAKEAAIEAENHPSIKIIKNCNFVRPK